jgi:hypothetical protein
VKVREYGNAIKQYVYRRDKEASPPVQTKEKRKGTKPLPRPLPEEGGE